jgi:hypothetical protein
MQLRLDSGYARSLLAIATRYVKPLGIDCFKISFIADSTNGDRKPAIRTGKQEGVAAINPLL